jgi:hypothetical protein
VTDDALAAALGAAILSAATLAIGYLHRRVHELRDRMRQLEAELEILEPITTAIRDRTRKEAVAILRRKRDA